MDLTRQLRHFLVVAEELHFGRAAELLGMAQPPLSQSIQRLERELGVQLFDRSRRQVELTVAGRLLIEEAHRLSAAEERLRTVMRKVRDGDLGTLRAGVPPDLPAPVLQALLRRLDTELPGVAVDLLELTTTEQCRMLATGGLDTGLVDHPVDAPELRFGAEIELPLGVVLPRTSPLARLREVALADLAGHDLVLFPRETAPGWYDRLLELCRTKGFVPARVRTARNPEFLFGLVLAGQGIALERESIARREPRVAWRPLTDRPLARRLLVVGPDAASHPAAPRFAELATEILRAEANPVVLANIGATGPWSVVYDAAAADHP
ncbi:LysR family transcriptional regulator [Nocardia sp. NPDC088792]|uniref:LysR family transcriptional regulator n=1 Tax=Nocardia sp. NPDC088792 TaxID=3364332 RepID=UPI003805779A